MSTKFVKEQSREDVGSEMPNDGGIKICSVGRLSHAKGFDMAVLACEELMKLGYDFKWYVIGYGSEENSIKELIKEKK